MKKFFNWFLISLTIGLFAQGCLGFAQEMGIVLDETPVPFGTLLESVGELIKNWKGLSGIGLASSLLALVIQALKTELLGGLLNKAGPLGPNIRRLIIFVLGQISGIVLSFAGGKFSLVEAIITGLITQGGAVALYEHLKPFFKRGLAK